MNKKIQKRLIQISKRLYHLPDGKNKHFSFILDKNKIISMGYNYSYKTHPESHIRGYRFCAMHSELSAVLKCRRKRKYVNLDNLTLVNIRLYKNKSLGMAMPCDICKQLIKDFRKVYYTNYNGDFIRLK